MKIRVHTPHDQRAQNRVNEHGSVFNEVEISHADLPGYVLVECAREHNPRCMWMGWFSREDGWEKIE